MFMKRQHWCQKKNFEYSAQCPNQRVFFGCTNGTTDLCQWWLTADGTPRDSFDHACVVCALKRAL